MYRSKRMLAVVVFLALSGIACGQPKIDGSSADSLKSSVNKVRSSLPREARADFDQAVMLISFRDGSPLGLLGMLNNPTVDVEGRILQDAGEDLNGMTADDVFAEAVRILEERKAAAEEYEAEQQRQEQEVRDFLAKFKVLEWKLWDRKPRHQFDRDLRELVLKVRNESPYAIERVEYKVTVSSPARAVPWAEEDDVWDVFRGGIEPGEEQICRLSRIQIDHLQYAEYPKDAEIRVEVISLSGPEFEKVSGKESAFGSAIARIGAPSFGDEEETILAKMRAYVSNTA